MRSSFKPGDIVVKDDPDGDGAPMLVTETYFNRREIAFCAPVGRFNIEAYAFSRLRYVANLQELLARGAAGEM